MEKNINNNKIIGLAEIFRYSHMKVLPEVAEANRYMVKAREIEQELGASSSMVVSRGIMECDMVEYVLNKMSKTAKEQTSLSKISRDFLEKIVQSDGASSNVAEKPKDQPSAIFDPSSNVAQQTLANYGFKLGAIVALTKQDPKKPKADVQFEIGFVNDNGSVGLHPIRADGSVDKATVVKTDQVTLNSTYKTIDASARLSVWDALVPGPSDIGQDFWTGVAVEALVAVQHQHHHCPTGSIYVQKTPTVKVVVMKVPDRDFVLTPYPAVVKMGKETSHTHLTIGANPPVVFNVEKPVDIKPKKMDLVHIIEFWRIRRTPDKGHANMVISTVEVVCPLPDVIRGLPKSVHVQVPVAVPCRKLKAGDELVLHIPAKAQAPKTEKLLPVLQEPAQKKQRTVD